MSANTLTRSSRRFASNTSAAVSLTGPRQIPGIGYYFDSATLPDGPVANWTDSVSGSSFTQATASAQPIKGATGLLFSTHGLQTAAPIVLGSTAYSIFITFCNITQQPSYGALLVNNSSFGFFINVRTVDRYYGGSMPVTQALPLGTFYDLLYVNLTLSTSRIYLNGVRLGDMSTPSQPGTPAPFQYIGTDNSNEFYKGYLNHIAIWPTTMLTDADAANLHNFRVSTCNGAV